jgi:hypothetical protein
VYNFADLEFKRRFRLTTQNPTTPNQDPPAHSGILQIVNGAYVAGAVSCLAQLGIPDLLENGAKSAEESGLLV